MPDLPSGTVTFLFSDIEGSTKLLHELGDGYADALAEHRELVRAAFAEHNGVEVDTQGDAFFSAFARATDAVAAAQEIQVRLAAWPDQRPDRRPHRGAADHRRGLCRARRAPRRAHLRGGSRGPSAPLATNPGARRRGRSRPRRAPAQGPPRATAALPARHQGLPAAEDARLDEPAGAGDSARRPRAGAGRRDRAPPGATPADARRAAGHGKTRLALQLAAEVADEFEHVWWVALDQIRDPQLVEPTIAQTIGARDDLDGYLRNRRALLLLDNLEQVLDCGPRLAELVTAASNLKLVATSREPLRLTVEQQYPVPPLPEDDAMALFEERARAVRPGLRRQRRRGRDLPPPGRPATRDRAGGGARQDPAARSSARSAGAAAPIPRRRGQGYARTTADAAGGDRLELRPARGRRAAGSGAALGLRRGLDARVGRGCLRVRPGHPGLARRQEPRPRAGWAVLDARDDSRIRARAARRAGAGRRFPSPLKPSTSSNRPRCTKSEYLRRPEPRAVRVVRPGARQLRAALDWWHEQESAGARAAARRSPARNSGTASGYWTEGRQRFEAALERAGEAPAEVRAGAEWRLSDVVARQGDYALGKELAESAIRVYEATGTEPDELRQAYITLAINEHKLGNVARAREIYDSVRADADERSLATILGNLGNIALEEHDYAAARAYLRRARRDQSAPWASVFPREQPHGPWIHRSVRGSARRSRARPTREPGHLSRRTAR